MRGPTHEGILDGQREKSKQHSPPLRKGREGTVPVAPRMFLLSNEKEGYNII